MIQANEPDKTTKTLLHNNKESWSLLPSTGVVMEVFKSVSICELKLTLNQKTL